MTGKNPQVVVGIDGSPASRVALEWALDKEQQLGPIRTVTAYSVGPLFDGFGMAPSAAYNPEVFRDSADARAVALLTSTDPALIDRHRTIQGSPGHTLVEAGNGADMLVVGCKSRSALAEALLGSTGSYCIKHSKVPVVLVPSDRPLAGLSRLVVGIDGSPNARAALRWALDHVAPGGTVVVMSTFMRIVHAFGVASPPDSELIAELTEVARKAIQEVATTGEIEQVIEIDAHIGDPRLELRQAAEQADALVIGTRGHRGVMHLLLGSTTTSLAHHPTSVTVVVPA